MNAVQRREALSRCLTETPCPVSATALAQRFSLSRQIGMLQLRRERSAYSDRHAASYNGVRAEISALQIGDMHASAFSLAVSRSFSHQLRHRAVKARAFGDAVAVASVRGGDIIRVVKQRANSGGNRFLSDAEMHGAAEPVRLEQAERFFLEASDFIHYLINPQSARPV